MRHFLLPAFMIVVLSPGVVAQETSPFQSLQKQYEKQVAELNQSVQLRTDRLKAQYKQQIEKLERLWDTVKMPEPKVFVQYSKKLDSRLILDFDHNRIMVESVGKDVTVSDMKRFLSRLRDDSDLLKSVLPDIEIVDREKKGMKSFDVATKSIAGNPIHRREISIPVEGWENRRVMVFWPKVKQISDKLGVDPILTMAVIQVESAFNPLAVSNANAIGLMQVVPDTAGVDVHTLIRGKGKPKAAELYDPETNILYGVAYLRILQQFYFKTFNPDSQLPLVISAYNAGPGRIRQIIRPWQPGARRWPAKQLRRELIRALRRAGIRETVDYLNNVLKQMAFFRKKWGEEK